MRALLDVNVLLALLDSDHVDHRRARAWSVASLFSLASLRAAAAPVTERVLFATEAGLCLNADPSHPSSRATRESVAILLNFVTHLNNS